MRNFLTICKKKIGSTITEISAKKRKSESGTLFSFFKRRNEEDMNTVSVAVVEESKRSGRFDDREEELSAAAENSSSVNFPDHTNDIGLIIKKQINDELKKDLANVWTPSVNFDFPASTNRNLRFQLKWLSEWGWLIYSPSEDGAFCKFCSLFATGVGHQSLSSGKLVTLPYRNWKKAREDFKRHETLQYHQKCKEKAANFIATYTGAKPTVDVIIDKGLQSQIHANREKLKPIIKTVALCAREGFALRGHRDSGPLQLDETMKKGEGHFRALLKFRIDAGDEILKKHLQTAANNATYISWQIQNEIISTFNDILLKMIVSKVNESKYFSVLADETTDIGGIQQMPLCVRFVENNIVREEFLQFLPLISTTGKALADTILEGLNDCGVDSSYLVGQGNDGASAMSGAYRGAQAIIREKYPQSTVCALQCSLP